MKEYKVRTKRELRDNFLDWLSSGENFTVVKDDTITVSHTNDNYIELKPNPTSYRWDYTYINDYKDEIISAIISVIFKNKNIVHLYKSWTQTGEEDWFYDTRNNKAFYIEDGKLHREITEENRWFFEKAVEDAEDELHINRTLITDDYVLTEKDKESIKNTDITEEKLLKVIKTYFKGKYATSHLGEDAKSDIGRYNYKFFFKCERCGKDDFHWHRHETGVLIDYFGPFYCEECQKIADKENKEKEKKRKKEHEYRMATDPEYRKSQEEMQKAMPTLYKVTPSIVPAESVGTVWEKGDDTPISLETLFGKQGAESLKDWIPQSTLDNIFEEKPMEPPNDTIKFVNAIMSRTKRR